MYFKKISFKVSRMYQESLNEVSFAILLHESHRSYPSRRRACFCVNHRSVWVLNHSCRIYRTKIFLNLKLVQGNIISLVQRIFSWITLQQFQQEYTKSYFIFFSYLSISPPCHFYIPPYMDAESFIVMHTFSDITIYLFNIYNICFP